jgi:hypothetical protein
MKVMVVDDEEDIQKSKQGKLIFILPCQQRLH